jgi:hypothetical protein
VPYNGIEKYYFYYLFYAPMNKFFCKKRHLAGNVLFLILLGIGLFGALTFIATKGLRSSSGKISEEKTKLAVSEMLSYADEIKTGFKKLLIQGTEIHRISLDMVTMTTQGGAQLKHVNDHCAVDTCKVFKPSGGGVIEKNFFKHGYKSPTWGDTWTHVGGIDFILGSIVGIGSNKSEILMRIVQLHPDICRELNRTMGIGDVNIGWEGGTYYGHFGNIKNKLSQTDAYEFGNEQPILKGKHAFCITYDREAIFVLQAR